MQKVVVFDQVVVVTMVVGGVAWGCEGSVQMLRSSETLEVSRRQSSSIPQAGKKKEIAADSN